MSGTKNPLEINVILYLKGLDEDGAMRLCRKGYRIAKHLLQITPETEIYLEEDFENDSLPRIAVEITVNSDLPETDLFRFRGEALRIKRSLQEKLEREPQMKANVYVKEDR